MIGVMDKPKNNNKIAVIISLSVAIVFGAVIFLPFALGVDMMMGGYALVFVSSIISISALVVAAFFWSRATTFKRFMNSEDILAHWNYSAEEWQHYIDLNFREEKKEKRGLYLVIAGFALFFSLIFVIINLEAGIIVLMVMAGLVIILAFFAFAMPYLNRARNRRITGEAYISASALYFNRTFYKWGFWGTKLKGVQVIQKDNSPAMLCFNYLHPTGSAGVQETTVSIPIPRGQEETAKNILKIITGN